MVQATTAGEVGGDAGGGALLEGVRMHVRGDGGTTATALCCLPGVQNLDPCAEHWVEGAALKRDDLLTAPGDNRIHTVTQSQNTTMLTEIIIKAVSFRTNYFDWTLHLEETSMKNYCLNRHCVSLSIRSRSRVIFSSV